MSADYQTHTTRQQAAAKLAHAEWLKTLTPEARKTLQPVPKERGSV